MCARDDELIPRLRRGDATAFATLVDRHHAALRRTARAFVSTPASADEVVQDTWLAVLGGLRSFAGRCSIKTWIFQILINRARTRGSREARVPVALPDASREPAAGATPTELLLQKELAGELAAAILGLPERQRAVVVLRDALGWSPDDVCDALAVNAINQRVILHRARSRLRASLEHYKAAG
jgi:RNA polymerase sigma-70 factor (ECF subfamily)